MQLSLALMAVTILWQVAQHQAAEFRSDPLPDREFMAFYTVGRIVNESPDRLYQPKVFLETYHALFPGKSSKTPLYAHAPFEAIIFSPFGRLPFVEALLAWQALSLALVSAGFALVWLSCGSLPPRLLPVALLLALSFRPVSVTTVLFGQASALTFFWIAVAIWCQRREWPGSAGAALSLCLVKPPLLVLLLPMLLVGRQVRILAGFVAGTVVLGTLSVLVVGWSACMDYVGLILQFGRGAVSSDQAFSPIALYVDLNAFARMLTGRAWAAFAVLIVVAVGVIPVLAGLWWHVPRVGRQLASVAWASTLTWTLVLNVYVPVYETPIAMIGAVLMLEVLSRSAPAALPVNVQLLLLSLYVAPWSPPLPLGGSASLQVFTLVLMALGGYQAWLGARAMREMSADNTTCRVPR